MSLQGHVLGLVPRPWCHWEVTEPLRGETSCKALGHWGVPWKGILRPQPLALSPFLAMS